MLAEDIDSSQCLERWHISGTRHYHVRLALVIVAGPFPNTDPGGGVLNGLIHVEVLQRRLLPGNDDVYVITASQTMVGYGKQRVRIGRQVNPHDFSLLVH